jgi:arylsulfatase A-like enzyme
MISRRALLASPLILKAADKPKQNILFIAIDDMNDWIGALGGYPGVITPNLDKLAQSGVNFRSAHCAAPLCNPARTALLMSRAPATTGVYLNDQPYTGSQPLKGAVSINQHYKNNGYLTLGCGKIYHGTYGRFADKAGWDDYGLPKEHDPVKGLGPLAGSAANGNFDFGPLEQADDEMLDYKGGDWVAQHLARKSDKPLFLAYGLAKPHLPWFVPKKYFDLYPLDKITLPIVKEDDLDDVPPAGRKMALQNKDHQRITQSQSWKKAVQAYLASITFADAMLGRVLRALESGPHAKSTTVALWSDHGWHLGEKLHWRKFTLWERSTRNILMVNSPGLTQPKGLCDRTVSMLDVYPTLNEISGLRAPEGLQGHSLVPLLKNPKAPYDRPAITTYGLGNHAVRSATMRYIRYKDGGEELYDRVKDPNEWTNVAAQPAYAAQKAQLQKFLPATDAPDAPREKGEGEA